MHRHLDDFIANLKSESLDAANATRNAIYAFSRRTHDVPIRREDWHAMIFNLLALGLGVQRWSKVDEGRFRQYVRAALLEQSRHVKHVLEREGLRLADTPARPSVTNDDDERQPTSSLAAEVLGRIYWALCERTSTPDTVVFNTALQAFCHFQLALALTDPEAPSQMHHWAYYHLRLMGHLTSPLAGYQVGDYFRYLYT